MFRLHQYGPWENVFPTNQTIQERAVMPGAKPRSAWRPWRDKSSEPMGTVLTQEVHFQNIEHMGNGCKQNGFHSFIFTKRSITVDLLQMLCWIVAITTLEILIFPTRGLFVGMLI